MHGFGASQELQVVLCAGLDARAANIVMRVVRNIANGRTIVCTIHQPSIAVFEVNESYILCC